MIDSEGKLHFYLNDHLGSARMVIDTAGTVKDNYDYYAFGEALDQTISTGQSYRYTGKPFDNDKDINLYYYGARYYDGTTGRFISVDPLAARYPTLSPYAYVANNPIIFIDANGDSVRVPSGTVGEAQFLVFLEMGRSGKLGESIQKLLASLDALPYDVILKGGDVPDRTKESITVGNTHFDANDLGITGIICTIDVVQIEATGVTLVILTVVHELDHADFGATRDRIPYESEVSEMHRRTNSAEKHFEAFLRKNADRNLHEFERLVKEMQKILNPSGNIDEKPRKKE